MGVVGSGSRVVERGMGSEIVEDKETRPIGDSSDANAVHRFDKMTYRQELGKLQCACDACGCGDSSACIKKRCSCCTVSNQTESSS